MCSRRLAPVINLAAAFCTDCTFRMSLHTAVSCSSPINMKRLDYSVLVISADSDQQSGQSCLVWYGIVGFNVPLDAL